MRGFLRYPKLHGPYFANNDPIDHQPYQREALESNQQYWFYTIRPAILTAFELHNSWHFQFNRSQKEGFFYNTF